VTHRQTNADPGVFIVSAPSGAGKTSLVSRLCQEIDRLVVCVSHTTRPMREGDTDGKDYHFVDEAAFEEMIRLGQFLEHARVFGNYYGTSVQAVEDCIAAGSDVILEIDWQGADQARARLDQAISIFILPPSREILLERLRGRGTDSEAVIERRTREAVEEMRHHHKADFLLINDDFEGTLDEFKSIIVSHRARHARRSVENAELISSLMV